MKTSNSISSIQARSWRVLSSSNSSIFSWSFLTEILRPYLWIGSPQFEPKWSAMWVDSTFYAVLLVWSTFCRSWVKKLDEKTRSPAFKIELSKILVNKNVWDNSGEGVVYGTRNLRKTVINRWKAMMIIYLLIWDHSE